MKSEKWSFTKADIVNEDNAGGVVISEIRTGESVLNVSEWVNIDDEVLKHIVDLHNKWVEESQSA